MNYKYYLTIFFLFSIEIIFAQKCFTVYDSNSKIIVPYANIVKENKIYANSDSEGKFCIAANELQYQFKISCVGYKTTTLDLTQNSIFLTTDIINLNEVVIKKPSFKKKVKLGSFKGSNIALTATYDLQFAEIGKVFILSDSKPQFLKKIKFHTFSSLPNRILGIKIYSLDENKQPKDLLSTENIIYKVKKGTHIATIDMSKSPLTLPKDGFVISLQILLLEQNKQYGEHNKFWYFYEPSIGATKDVSEAYYFSSTEEGIWKKHENCDLNIQVELTN